MGERLTQVVIPHRKAARTGCGQPVVPDTPVPVVPDTCAPTLTLPVSGAGVGVGALRYVSVPVIVRRDS